MKNLSLIIAISLLVSGCSLKDFFNAFSKKEDTSTEEISTPDRIPTSTASSIPVVFASPSPAPFSSPSPQTSPSPTPSVVTSPSPSPVASPIPSPSPLVTPSPLATLEPTPTRTPVTLKSITLLKEDVLEIKGADLVAYGDIVLEDKAVLVIEDSTFEHSAGADYALSLKAFDQARVIIKNSTMGSGKMKIYWEFYDESSLEMDTVDNSNSFIGYVFKEQSAAKVSNSMLLASIQDQVTLDLENSQKSSISFHLPKGTQVDLQLPSETDFFEFPSSKQIEFRFTATKSSFSAWGLHIYSVINSGDSITVRDTQNLGITIHSKTLWDNLSKYDDLSPQTYKEQTYKLDGFFMELLNTSVTSWSLVSKRK